MLMTWSPLQSAHELPGHAGHVTSSMLHLKFVKGCWLSSQPGLLEPPRREQDVLQIRLVAKAPARPEEQGPM